MKKILVANRGEIALRIMRTAKKMGIPVLAIYSEADRNAPHVRFADEAVLIGSPPSAQSYLRAEKIIETALQYGADAIHPGYGFLSENSNFAQLCEAHNLTFIGPSAFSIEIMGSKLAAKEAVKHYGIPMVPGVDHSVSDEKEAREIALQRSDVRIWRRIRFYRKIHQLPKAYRNPGPRRPPRKYRAPL